MNLSWNNIPYKNTLLHSDITFRKNNHYVPIFRYSSLNDFTKKDCNNSLVENIADLNPYILLHQELQFEKFLSYKYSQIQVVLSKIIPKILVLIRLCMAIIIKLAFKLEVILRRLILEVRKNFNKDQAKKTREIQWISFTEFL